MLLIACLNYNVCLFPINNTMFNNVFSLTGPNMCPTTLFSNTPQFATVAAANSLASCRTPNVPMAAAATATECVYPSHGSNAGYMNGQAAATHPSLLCNTASETRNLHAPPHYYSATINGSRTGGDGDEGEGSGRGSCVQDEPVNVTVSAQQQDGGLRPVATRSQENGCFSRTSVYYSSPAIRRPLDLQVSTLLPLGTSSVAAPTPHYRPPLPHTHTHTNDHQPLQNGVGSASPSSPGDPCPAQTNGHTEQEVPPPPTMMWSVNGIHMTQSAQVQVGYGPGHPTAGSAWQQLPASNSPSDQGNATDERNFYENTPASLFR